MKGQESYISKAQNSFMRPLLLPPLEIFNVSSSQLELVSSLGWAGGRGG